jgi:SPP1 family predicted phage head-tail adaptor
VEAGDLRHRITIQQRTDTQDAYGEPIPAWTTWATVWAAIEPQSGQEATIAMSQQSEARLRVRVRVRYRAGLSVLMRIAWKTKTYQIEAISEVQTNRREYHLICYEVQA